MIKHAIAAACLLFLFLGSTAAEDINSDYNAEAEMVVAGGYAVELPVERVLAIEPQCMPVLNADEHTIAFYHADDVQGTIVSDETGNYDAIASSSLIWDLLNKKYGISSLGCNSQYWVIQDSLFDHFPEEGTVDLWFRVNNLPSGGQSGTIFQKITASWRDEIAIFLQPSGQIHANLYHGRSYVSLISHTTVWPAGQWNQVAFTWKANGDLKLYINGVLEDSNNSSIRPSDGTFGNFIIGSTHNLGTNLFPGQIDEFRVSDIARTFPEDSDCDGVIDPEDQCPSTPSGEVVDEFGCSCSQKVCDDGNPCTDDSCNWGTALCEFVDDNENVCGFPRDCADIICILHQEPPYFFWKLFPDDGHDYCVDGACVQYFCELVSEDFNAECSFADTSELEAKVEELEGKVGQLEEQNLQLQGQVNLLEAGLNSLQQAFNSFVSVINAYLLNLPQGLRQGMLCGLLEQSGETSGDGFGLHCEINDNGQCKCAPL